jgi:A/G-specific adenine glycosylase
VARRQGAQEAYPLKTRKLRRSSESLWMLLAHDVRGRVWLEKRAARGIWAGLYCLPIFDSRASLLEGVPARERTEARDEAAFLHVLTHKDLHLHPVSITCRSLPAPSDTGAWFEAAQWRALGLPAPVRKLLLQAA